MTLPWVYKYMFCFFWGLFGVSEVFFFWLRFYEDMTQILIILYFSLWDHPLQNTRKDNTESERYLDYTILYSLTATCRNKDHNTTDVPLTMPTEIKWPIGRILNRNRSKKKRSEQSIRDTLCPCGSHYTLGRLHALVHHGRSTAGTGMISGGSWRWWRGGSDRSFRDRSRRRRRRS